MKKNLLLLVLLPSWAIAQEKLTDKLSEVRAPQSPAAALLGVQPNVINRPKSYQALETALYTNFFSGGQLTVPNDFALEFSPFWASERKLSVHDFLVPDYWEGVKRSTSISLASTQKYLLRDSVPTNAIALGVRTLLLNGTSKERHRAYLIYEQMRPSARLSRDVYDLIDDVLASPASRAGGGSKADLLIAIRSKLEGPDAASAKVVYTKEEWQTLVDDVIELLDRKAPEGAFGPPAAVPENNDPDAPAVQQPWSVVDDLLDEHFKVNDTLERIRRIQEGNRGFRIELAGSVLFDFPTNENDYSYAAKGGLWLTPSYQPINLESFEFLAVLRVLWYNQKFYETFSPGQFTFQQNMDYGGRIVFKRPKFSLEAEVVGRQSTTELSSVTDESTGITTTQKKTETDLQYLVNFNYKLTEAITLSYMFGKQLDPVLTANFNGAAVSLLTLNWGLGGPTVADDEVRR